MSKPLIKQLLMSSNYWTLNKELVRMYGLEPAFLLTNLSEAEQLMADSDGWFYQTSDTLEEITGITRYKQDRAIDLLEKRGVLKKEVRGVPAKRYFKLNYKILEAQIESFLHTRLSDTSNPVCEELTDKYAENLQQVKNIDKEHTDKEHKIKSQDKPDTIYEDVVSCLNEKTGNRYRHQTEETRRLIRARQREGYTLDDFKTVIDKKVKEWKGSEFEKFLRPATLFGNKFESYLNQTEGKAKTSGNKGYQPRSLPETYTEDPDDFASWFKE